MLVVDDDPQCRRLTLRLLGELGYESTYEAASAVEALLMLPRVQPGIVLTDIAMEQESSGLVVVEQVRAVGIPVGLISGIAAYADDPLLARLPRVLKEELTLESLAALISTLQADG